MKAVSLFLAYFLTLNAFAYPVGFKGQKDTASQYSSTINAPNRSITNQGASNSLIETRNTNLLANASFEHATYDSGWTCSGTGTESKETSIVIDGNASAKVVTSSETMDCVQTSTLYAAQVAGVQGVATAWIKSTSAISEVCAVVDSVDTNCVTIEANNTWKEYVIPFVMGSTNNGIRIKSASDSGTTYIDNAFVGVMPATMMPEVSQAQLYGQAKTPYTANCAWSSTSTTFGEFGADADCPIPTLIGNALAPATKIPATSFLNMPAGFYKVTARGSFRDSTLDSNACAFAISDGTSRAGQTQIYAGASMGSVVSSVIAVYEYTSAQASKTFSVQVRSDNAGNTCNLAANDSANEQSFDIIVEYYPPKSKIYSGDTIYPHAQLYGTLRYQGIANCSYAFTTTSFANLAADTDCNNATVTGSILAPATKIPAFVLPAGSKAGTYKIAISAFLYKNAGDFTCYARLNDGTQSSEASAFGTNQDAGGGSVIDATLTYSSDIVTNTTVNIQTACSSATGGILINSGSLGDITFSVYYFPPKDNPIIGTFAGIEKCANDFECTDVFSANVSSTGVVSGENIDWINGNFTVASPAIATLNTGLNLTQGMKCVATAANGGNRNFTTTSTTPTTITIQQRTIDTVTSTVLDTGFQIICQKSGSDYKPKTAKAATTNEMMYVPNVTRPKTCYYAFGGASATLASPTVCAASPCVEVYDSCSAVTVPTRGGTGLYNDLTFANGTWKASSMISCKVTPYSTSSGSASYGNTYFITSDQTWSTNANGGYVANIVTTNVGGSVAGLDAYVLMECTADAP